MVHQRACQSGIFLASSRAAGGIAVDLEVGLLVPVLRNVGERDSADLRARLDRVRADAAARSIPPEGIFGYSNRVTKTGQFRSDIPGKNDLTGRAVTLRRA
jgi:pyruvate/2-oxoglutarate dehydrogenase complex dihydrolipoamide acyltransferase (E2) component